MFPTDTMLVVCPHPPTTALIRCRPLALSMLIQLSSFPQPVLPNGVSWKQNLLLYVFSSKILADTEAVLKIQSASSQMQNLGAQKIPPLPYLLSNMIQSKTPRKAPNDERCAPSPRPRQGDELWL